MKTLEEKTIILLKIISIIYVFAGLAFFIATFLQIFRAETLNDEIAKSSGLKLVFGIFFLFLALIIRQIIKEKITE